MIKLIPKREFYRIVETDIELSYKLSLIADMCRLNTLSSVKLAGSGHLGSSFSSMDIFVWLFYYELNTVKEGFNSPNRDLFFSSKGHDVPGLYSVFYSLGIISKEKLLMLRRLGGLHGHPDISTPGIETNSGSLGMGISKAKGYAWAKHYLENTGRVFVLIGDGELQEGQNYEALQTGAKLTNNKLTVIVDHNKIQTDMIIDDIVNWENIEEKLSSFGWSVYRCNGNSIMELMRTYDQIKQDCNCPNIIIADTVKGEGISFMEHPQALKDGNGYYEWHAGAPSDEHFSAGSYELLNKINRKLDNSSVGPIILKDVYNSNNNSLENNIVVGEQLSETEIDKLDKVSSEYVANCFGEELVNQGHKRDDIIVFDADLSADCRLRKFEIKFPDRFIEVGIAEQDMVSMAGAVARQGLLPIVNSFGSFLSSRANEQVYNNSTENSKIIYVCHYSGLIPAGPGQSHQSLRDISLFGALNNMTIVQPCNGLETRLFLDYCINKSSSSYMLRLIIGPSPQIIKLPDNYELIEGVGSVLEEGNDAIIFCYGPVMLHEALVARKLLNNIGFYLKVVNLSWLNLVDIVWLDEVTRGIKNIYVLEDHSPVGGLGDFLLNQFVTNGLLGMRHFEKIAVEGHPACGNPKEVLAYHGLDGSSLFKRIGQRKN